MSLKIEEATLADQIQKLQQRLLKPYNYYEEDERIEKEEEDQQQNALNYLSVISM